MMDTPGSVALAPTQVPRAPVPLALPQFPIHLQINGKRHYVAVEAWVTLLDLLREQLGLTGTKKGCDQGQCGACTVLLNGKRINSCLTLAVMHDGASIVTVEGLADGDTLHPLQQAFIAHDAFQCGYCTPGQLCSAIGLQREGKARTEADVRELMSGNLCRCGAYPQIVSAVCQVLQIPSATPPHSAAQPGPPPEPA
jgi:xanthine dehydrogenase YagT iron-sulfur-binding subunit